VKLGVEVFRLDFEREISGDRAYGILCKSGDIFIGIHVGSHSRSGTNAETNITIESGTCGVYEIYINGLPLIK